VDGAASRSIACSSRMSASWLSKATYPERAVQRSKLLKLTAEFQVLMQVDPALPRTFWNLQVLHSFLRIRFWEEPMFKAAAVLVFLVSPALADDKPIDPAALQNCPPIGQSAKAELIYAMDCPALKPENRVEVMPNMPPTNMKDTVIPKSGGQQNPDTTPTRGEPE
jgi:hypothetical protein